MGKEQTSSTRRQWITAATRWGAIGAVAAAWLRVSSKKTSGEQACVDLKGKKGCRACGLFANCSLPRALSVKQFLTKARSASDGIQAQQRTQGSVQRAMSDEK